MADTWEEKTLCEGSRGGMLIEMEDAPIQVNFDSFFKHPT